MKRKTYEEMYDEMSGGCDFDAEPTSHRSSSGEILYRVIIRLKSTGHILSKKLNTRRNALNNALKKAYERWKEIQ